ncbi:hypothetical protein DDZ18_10420 [Marinicauda salina]|jgi:hypothetical protein|uniref:Secreted protein n=1 Tax=Marinicauda salina TaxID=2135793 RepID=A0A2U2BSX6_9PROT|nr:hypothetical protein [Marinicauda salina]PWE17104.1 hypothetical protein DDZ18_10420 [Marinicauda salina]
MINTLARAALAPLAASALVACATTSNSTQAALEPALQVSYPGDADMSCAELETEIARMEQMMADAQQGAASAEASEQVAGAAGAAAVSAAGYSGALGRAPGLGILANAASGVAADRARAEAERRAENARTAELRRTSLNGLHAGKGC